ncbi:glycosyltransferase family 4 protein [Pseudomonadota bacterium]
MTKADSHFGESLNVLFLVDRWVAGGVKKHLEDLCHGFNAKGVNCIIVGWLPQGEPPPEGNEFHFIPIYDDQGNRSILGFFKSVVLVRKLLKDRTIDILHLHSRYLTPIVATSAMGMNRPTVFTAHNVFNDLRYLPWYPRNVICLNEEGKQAFLKNKCLPRNLKIGVVPNGIDVTTSSIDQSSAKKSGNLEPQATGYPFPTKTGAGKRDSFLFLGRLVKWKGADLILRALAEVEDHDMKIEIAGSGPEEQALHRLTQELGLGNRVRFLGWVENPDHLLDEAAALIVPSTGFEGFGYVVLEAFARGKPVIASDLCVFDETVIEGVTGLRFKSGNYFSLAKALLQAKESPGELSDMGKKGFNLLTEKYTLNQMIEDTLKVYKAALGVRDLPSTEHIES